MLSQDIKNALQKMGWIASCSCHGLSTCAKYIAKNDMDCILLLLASRCLQDGPRSPQEGRKMAQDGPKMAPRCLLGPPLELSWVQLVAILSQRKAIEGFILSQDNQKYIEKMGWFAYSLQEVLSYIILSPRCLYDGLCCLQGHTKTSKEPICKLSEGPTDAVSGSSWI